MDDLAEIIPNPTKYFGDEKEITVYEGKPGPTNNNTGYKGRTAIFETIFMTPELQEFILKSPSSKEIRKFATEQGAETFFQDGVTKVMRGVTTLEELLRVAPLDSAIDKLYDREKGE
jgi:type II secretory ATPase GspE/PulE/Tfp pilus assembly ATPase PilB-like protein